MLSKNCLICHKEFFKSPSVSLFKWNTTAKFCSHICHSKSLIKPDKLCVICGKIISKYAKKYCSQRCAGISTGFKKGNPAPETAFKKQDKRIIGEANPFWKGEEVGYIALHTWVKRNKGRASYCMNPNCKYPRTNSRGDVLLSPKKFEWANISREYKRNLDDWVSLCVSCHQYADYHKLDIEDLVAI